MFSKPTLRLPASFVFLACLSLAACGPAKDASSPSASQSAPASASGPASNQSGPAGGDRASRPQAVTTVMTRIESVPIVLSAQGNVLSLDEVDVRPQKTGVVSQIHFKEGDEVRRGQLLFSLDDREDAANTRKAEATLQGAQSQIVIAQREVERNQDLFNQKFVSSAVLDASRNKLETLQSSLAQNKAALDQVRVVLSYARITAPFDGRAGRIDVRVGSLVLSNATTSLVKITRMDPIGVTFALPERDLARLQAAQAKGAVEVRVEIPNQKDSSVKGKVVFVESSVDKISGTIGVKARVENDARKLWPGQYVTVRVNAGETPDAVVLPPQAIVNGPKERFVYVVKDDMTVAQQPVEIVRMGARNAIVKGVDAGLKVVLEGAANLRPGSKVFETKGEGGRGGRGGNKDAQSAPAADTPKADTPTKPESIKEKKSAPKEGSAAKPIAAGGKKGFVAPEGFTPRDPEAWAKFTDEEKAERVNRWRERQAAKAAGGAQ